MKKFYLLIVFMLLLPSVVKAQQPTTEDFEKVPIGRSEFVSNGQLFKIKSVAPSSFDIFNYDDGGWNGKTRDNRFIDNSGTTFFDIPVEFSVTTEGVPFYLKSMYLFLSQSNLSLHVQGELTLTGKFLGNTVFESMYYKNFFNTDRNFQNGFTLIDLSRLGGLNNAIIDEIVIKTSGNIAYVGLDAFTWQKTTCGSLVLAPSQENVLCNGDTNGSATVIASGGIAPYTYSWNDANNQTTATATNLAAGTYTVTVTDASGCIASQNFTLSQPIPVVPPTVVDQEFCYAEAKKVSDLVATGNNIKWYGTATAATPLNANDVLTPGTYFATQTLNGCESMVRTPVTVSFSLKGLIKQKWNDVLLFDNSSNNYIKWQWFKDGVAINGATNQYYNSPQPLHGIYHVIITDKLGNTAKTCSIEIASNKKNNRLSLAPNPVRPGQTFTLMANYTPTELNGAKLIISDLTGKLISQITNVKPENILQAPQGATVYIINLQFSNGEKVTTKLLVN